MEAFGSYLKAVNNGQEPALPSSAARIQSEVDAWGTLHSRTGEWPALSLWKQIFQTSPQTVEWLIFQEILSQFNDFVAKDKGGKLRLGSQQWSGAYKADSSSLMAGMGPEFYPLWQFSYPHSMAITDFRLSLLKYIFHKLLLNCE